MNDLAELLSSMRAERQDKTIDPTIAVEILKTTAPRFTAPNPYKVGDFVTPRKDGYLKNAGEPHLVVEVSNSFPRLTENHGTPSFGTTPTIRTANVTEGGSVLAFWNDHAEFDPYPLP